LFLMFVIPGQPTDRWSSGCTVTYRANSAWDDPPASTGWWLSLRTAEHEIGCGTSL